MRPLEGIKIVELATWIAAPRCACHLADMGANVIKVEPPIQGDPLRGSVVYAELPPVANYNYMFQTDNRNKKSVTIDLTQQRGKDILHKLVKEADVIVTNLLPEVQKKLEVDYEHLIKVNPKIIYANATAWGLHGPDKDKDGFDTTAFARSGIINAMGEHEVRRPATVPGMGDAIMAVWMAYGITLALFHRERTGEGQQIHVSLLGSLLDIGNKAIQAVLSTKHDIPKYPRKTAVNALFNYYQTKDGRWIVLTMGQMDRFWHDVCEAIDAQELENDPKFNSNEARYGNHEALISILDEIFATRSLAEWDAAFKGRNVLWSRINTFGQVASDPQVLENDYVIKFNHPNAGPIDIMGIPLEFSKSPGEIKSAAPELGQHTEEVLVELGYSWDDIIDLRDGGIV